MRFHLHVRTTVVKVKAILLGVDGLNGRLGLLGRSTGLEQPVLVPTLADPESPQETSFQERSKPTAKCRRGEGTSIEIAVA